MALISIFLASTPRNVCAYKARSTNYMAPYVSLRLTPNSAQMCCWGYVCVRASVKNTYCRKSRPILSYFIIQELYGKLSC